MRSSGEGITRVTRGSAVHRGPHAEDTLDLTSEAARTLNLRARMDLSLARALASQWLFRGRDPLRRRRTAGTQESVIGEQLEDGLRRARSQIARMISRG